jgi:transcriptional regulator with XRE-family HTH domain
MTLISITGSQLHAARVLVGLSREEVAKRAGLCRHSIRKWETSSHAIPGAMSLCRVVDVLERQRGTASRYGPGCWGSSRRRMPREHEQEPRSAKVL